MKQICLGILFLFSCVTSAPACDGQGTSSPFYSSWIADNSIVGMQWANYYSCSNGNTFCGTTLYIGDSRNKQSLPWNALGPFSNLPPTSAYPYANSQTLNAAFFGSCIEDWLGVDAALPTNGVDFAQEVINQVLPARVIIDVSPNEVAFSYNHNNQAFIDQWAANFEKVLTMFEKQRGSIILVETAIYPTNPLYDNALLATLNTRAIDIATDGQHPNALVWDLTQNFSCSNKTPMIPNGVYAGQNVLAGDNLHYGNYTAVMLKWGEQVMFTDGHVPGIYAPANIPLSGC